MFLLGSLVNGIGIVIGSLFGFFLKNIKEPTKEIITKGIGLGVVALGAQMAIKANDFTLLIICISLGGFVGEFIQIEQNMHKFGLWLERRFARGHGQFAEGFITASLIFVIGSMGIIGALEGGANGNHQTLYTKAVMDGFLAIMLTASLGLGVMFSAIPVFLYEGLIALIAWLVLQQLPLEVLNDLMTEISAIGGVLILGIGLNLLKVTQLRVANLLPAIIFLGIWFVIK